MTRWPHARNCPGRDLPRLIIRPRRQNLVGRSAESGSAGVPDVTCRANDSRVRLNAAPPNLTTLRQFAVNLQILASANRATASTSTVPGTRSTCEHRWLPSQPLSALPVVQARGVSVRAHRFPGACGQVYAPEAITTPPRTLGDAPQIGVRRSDSGIGTVVLHPRMRDCKT